jgi:hypothetical protein
MSDDLIREWAGPEAHRPLTPVILVVIAVMAASAVFWVGFMLAPAAVLLVGYLALSAGDRAQRQRLGAARAGRGDVGRGDVGRGDVGRGDVGRGDVGRGDEPTPEDDVPTRKNDVTTPEKELS